MQTATVLSHPTIMNLLSCLVATICKPARQGRITLVYWCLLLLAMLVNINALAASTPSLEHLEHRRWLAADGGPSQVGAIAQTRNGYLWLGTNDSLYRFDGSRFVRYEAPDGKALGIVSSLLADGDDLWVGLRAGGVARVHPQGMQRYTPDATLPGGVVYSLARDRQGAIWAAADDGLARFDGKRWQHVSADLKFPGRKARTVFVDRSGTVWAVNEYRLFYLPEGATAFMDSGVTVEGVSSIAQAADDSIWLAERYSGKLHRIVTVAGKLFISKSSHAAASGLLFDRSGALWISTLGRGLKYVAAPTDMNAIGARERFAGKDGLSSDYVWPMLEDRDGNVWVGTNAGLDRFRPRVLMPSDFPTDALNYALVAGGDGSIWAGSANRPAMRMKSGNVYPLTMPAPATSAIRDSKEHIWMAGSGGIWRSEGERLVFAAYLPQGAPADSAVRAMVHDLDGNLWVAINRLGLYKLHAGVWSQVPAPTSLPSQLMPVVASADAQGRLWFGYRDNLLVMRDAHTEKQWSKADGLHIGHITAITPQAGRTWIGGQHGLGFIQGQRFHAVQMPGNGLFDNIYAILLVPGKDGEDVWIHSKAGIFELSHVELEHALADPAYQIRYRSYNLMGGLANDPYQVLPLPTAIRADDGLLWFSTSNGVMWIDPQRPRQDDAVPEVTIESVSVDGAFLAQTTPTVLAANAQRIVIDYAALSLSAPESLSFRYRLDGYDHGWHDAGRQSEATYTALAAGNYRFRVLAYNKDGLPSSQEAVFAFTIPQVFYKQPLFLLIAGVAIFVLLWIFYRINARRAAEHMRTRMEERHAERERIARELHDTLLQGVYGLILRFQAVAQSIPADHPARIGLEKALDRADEVLIEGRDRVRDLRNEVVTGDLHDCIRALGVSLAYDGSAAFHLSVIGTPLPLRATVRDEIYRIAHEAINNAFRHARAQQVLVKIEYTLRAFRLTISDDGVGIDQAYISIKGRPDHWGLRGMHERAHKIGANLNIKSIGDAGTEIVLSMSARLAYRNIMRCWLNRISWRKKPGIEL
ncbi:histidine kinase [Herminiimonas sp. KBW02]|uniref:sensor histidine kinase n=1 Tax=Herminiimonas sp. KBW02 TaxID=2153363 RepID=UPI000F593280|nr:sensor histidine kinase [Herminiimonas sp. KBW02]RQO36050.1 histidine kinase [Herminiimonas sp. KBW02]